MFVLYVGVFFFFPPPSDLLSFALFICKERVFAVQYFIPVLQPLPQAVVPDVGEVVYRAEHLVKGIFKAVCASELICSLSAQAGFHKIFLC